MQEPDTPDISTVHTTSLPLSDDDNTLVPEQEDEPLMMSRVRRSYHPTSQSVHHHTSLTDNSKGVSLWLVYAFHY